VADAAIPPGGTEVLDPPWDPWRPADIARLLAGVTAPWYVAGGWAIDLFLGRQTREHGDLEIAVPASAFPAIRGALADYEFDVVGSGLRWPLDSPAFDVMHQTWVREPDTGVYRADVFREPERDAEWVCRRDESISLPYEDLIRQTGDGIPYLVPEVNLLFKAKRAAEPKNHADFAATADLLDDHAAGWLRGVLQRVHPGHAWIGALDRPCGDRARGDRARGDRARGDRARGESAP
jgi:Aminoglycoside-2''-adenylyltransferase